MLFEYFSDITCNLSIIGSLIWCSGQVLLQTYIEYLRGKIEEKKEMNHHGRGAIHRPSPKMLFTPV